MVKGSLVLGLFLPLFALAQPVASGTIPTSIQELSQGELDPENPPQTTASHTVSQKQAPHTGNNYALDPFGMIHNTADGQGDDENEGHQIKQTTTSKVSETSSSAATAKSASNTGSAPLPGHSTSSSKTEASMNFKSETSVTEASSSGPPVSWFSASSATSVSPTVTHKPVNDALDGDYSSSTSMNSWKIIGIGVLAIVAVALLVIVTAFHDAILRAICRPFQRRKDGKEVLVPDWRRGSWRFADDGYAIEKPGFDGQDEEGPRIGEGEKGELAFPLPPVSPFPIRRAPSASSRHLAEPGIAGVGARSTALMKPQGNNIGLPSAPPMLQAPNSSREKAKASHSPPGSPRDVSESEAYGGME